jgi:Fe-S oxidoreductase
VAKRLDKWFRILKPKKLLILCTAGTNVFKNILPHYGLTYKFEEIKSYIEYLWEGIESGNIEIRKKLDISVAIQDSCYSKMFGDRYMDLPRKILSTIGVKIIEIKASREDMRCCGIGAGFSVDSSYQPIKIRSAALRNFKEFKKAKVKAVCVYCAGCLATFIANKKLYSRKLRIYHIIELLQKAIGETPSLTKRAKKKRAKHFFWGTIWNQVPKIFSKKTFKIAKIPEDPPPYGDAW